MIHRYVVDTEFGPFSLASDETFVSIERKEVTAPGPDEVLTPDEMLFAMLHISNRDEIQHSAPITASFARGRNASDPELNRYVAWYKRDEHITGRLAATRYPEMQEAGFRFWAPTIADVDKPRHCAERGMTVHHHRRPDDPMLPGLIAGGRTFPWYAGFDATILNLIDGAQAMERNPDLALDVVRTPRQFPNGGQAVLFDGKQLNHLDVAIPMTEWLLQKLDNPMGLAWVPAEGKDSYQDWMDSVAAYCYSDGELATPPVATVHVQSWAFEALQEASRLLVAFDVRPDLLEPIEKAMDGLRRRVLDDYFVEDERGAFCATAVDTDGRPLDVRTVNMGIALRSPLFDGEDARSHRETIIKALFQPDMLSRYGLRGRSDLDVRFSPSGNGYHESVWLWATMWTAEAIERHEMDYGGRELRARAMRTVKSGLFPEYSCAINTPEPELCNYVLTVARDNVWGERCETVIERTPQPDQAWTVGGVINTLEVANKAPRISSDLRTRELEATLLDALPERAYRHASDLAWAPRGIGKGTALA